MDDKTFVLNLPPMDENNLQKADQLFFDADEKIKQGLIAEAKTLLEKALEFNPKHGRSHNHIGWLYEIKYQDFAQAEEHYKKALEFAPEYPAGYTNYAVVLSSFERYDELSKHLEKTLTIPGVNKETVYNEYGIMYEKQGKLAEAIEAYTKALGYTLNEQAVAGYKSAIARCKAKLQ